MTIEPTPHAPHWEPHYHYDCRKCWANGTPPADERHSEGGDPWDESPTHPRPRSGGGDR